MNCRWGLRKGCGGMWPLSFRTLFIRILLEAGGAGDCSFIHPWMIVGPGAFLRAGHDISWELP